MFVEVLGSILRLLEAEYLIHIEIEPSDEVGPLSVIVAGTGYILVLVDVARLVVVALEEHIFGVVGPLVILFVVKLELVLNWLLGRLRHGVDHWLGGRGGGLFLARLKIESWAWVVRATKPMITMVMSLKNINLYIK
jgi:hypothetical protein